MAQVTEEEKELLEAMKVHKIETKSDFEQFIQAQNPASPPSGAVPKFEAPSVKFPRISLFFGEPGKGEVTYRTWRYEVNCLLREKSYSKESLMLGIRRSLRGEAAAMLMRLGETASIDSILDMFHSSFGNTETPESILKRFHACEQELEESVVTYACRVEELFSQAVELGALLRSQQVLLKSVFYEGLNTDLKIASTYKFESISDYNTFKAEIRKLEEEMKRAKSKTDSKKKATCSAASKKDGGGDSKPSSELGEVKELLEKLNQRIDKLEEEKKTATNMQQQQMAGNVYRGARGMRHFRGRGRGNFQSRPYRGHGRGQSQYKPRRPTAGATFKPSGCFNCGEEGHFARNCPLNG